MSSSSNTPSGTPRTSNDFKPESFIANLFKKDVADLLQPLSNIEVNHKIDFTSQFQPIIDSLKKNTTTTHLLAAGALVSSFFLAVVIYRQSSKTDVLSYETKQLKNLLVQMHILKADVAKGFVPEGVIDDHDIANLATAIFSFFTSESNTLHSQLSTLIKTTRISGVATTVVKLARTIFSWLSRLLCTDVHLFDFMHKTGISTIDEFLEESRVICRNFDQGTLECNVDMHNKVVDLRDTVVKLTSQMPRDLRFNDVRLVVLNIDNKLDKILRHIKSSDYKSRGARVEPIGLMMVGPPGIGKSVSMMWFSAQILDKSGVLNQMDRERHNSNPNLFIYNRQAENVYWDGYEGQPITLYDDILQARDVAGQPDNEVMNIIRNINTFENVLHCAALDKKGNTFFSSKFVLSTSNREKFDINSITEIEAFVRRWNIIIKGRLKPEFAIDTTGDRFHWKIDPSKLPVIDGVPRLGPHICDWWIQKGKPGNAGVLVDDTGLPMLPEDIVQLIVSNYKRQQNYHVAMMDLLKIPAFSPESGVDVHMIPLTKDEDAPTIFDDLDMRSLDDWTYAHKRFYGVVPSTPLEHDEFVFFCDENLEKNDEPLSFHDYVRFVEIRTRSSTGETDAMFIRAKKLFEDIWFSTSDSFFYFVDMIFVSLKSSLLNAGASMASFVLKVIDLLSPYFLRMYTWSASFYHTPVLAACLAGWILYGVLSRLFLGTPDYDLVPDSNHASERISRHKVGRKLKSTVSRSIVEPESGNSRTPAAMVVSRMYDIYWCRKGHSTQKFGSVLPVARRVFMMNHHFMNQIEAAYWDEDSSKMLGHDADYVFFVRAGESSSNSLFKIPIQHLLNANHFVADDDCDRKDVIFVSTDRCAPDFKDITSWFVKEQQLDHSRGFDVSIVISDQPCREVISYATFKDTQHVDEVSSLSSFEVDGVLLYAASTANGWCGSPILNRADRGKPVLLGIHFAGTGQHGVGALITQEFIRSKISLFDNQSLISEIVFPESGFVPQAEAEVKTMFGRMLGKSPNVSRKSKLEKSLLADALAPMLKYPAYLAVWYDDAGIKRDPLRDALEGYCPRPIFVSPSQLDACWRGYLRFLRNVSLNVVVPETYSYETAVTGQPFADKIGKIDRKTSAGYPYNVQNKVKNKTPFYGKDGPYEFGNIEETMLRDHISMVETKAKKRERILHLFTDTLKDETLSPKKVEKRMSRFISATPLPLLILSRMYFGAFQKFLRDNFIVNGVAIGINPYCEHWDFLAQHLKGFGESRLFGAGDFKGFDKRHQTQILWAIHDLIQEWYGKHDVQAYNVRNTLWFELVNSYHVCDGYLYQWLGSLPSGHPLTSIVNCVYNHILFRMCYCDITGLDFYQANEEFSTDVTLVVLGDDNVYSYPNIVSEWHAAPFDMYNLSQAMIKYGQEYTRADKLTVEPGFSQQFSELTFLKRYFRVCEVDGLVVAPLEIDSIISSLQWKKRSVDTSIFLEIVLRAYIELSVHSTPVWCYWKSRIDRALDTNKLPRPAISDDRKRLVEEFRGIQDCAVAAEPVEDIFVPESAVTVVGDSQIPHKKPPFSSRAINMMTTNTDTRMTGLTADLTTSRSEIETNVEQVALTTIANDSLVQAVTMIDPMPTLDEATDPNTETYDTSIVSFLARPNIISQGDFALTDSSGTVIFSVQSPHALLAGNSVWAAKLNGVISFKGTLVLRLQANASRFQQGRYILGFVYDGGCTSSYKIQTAFKTHTATLTEQTQVPHVEFDLSCDTEVTIRLPHVNCVNRSIFYNNGVSAYSVGTAFLSCYSPLVAASGLTTCRYNLYAHFEDVELGFPVVPQSSASVGVRTTRKLKSSKEEQFVKEGPIGEALGKISRTATVLGDIPVLSSVTTPVSWISATLQRAASIWGFSRPGDSQKATVMTPMFIDGFTNVDGLDKSNKLAFSKDAVVQHTAGLSFGGIDEMALAHIISKPAFYQSFTWSTSDSENAQKIYLPMQPRYLRQTVSRFGVATEHTTPLAYYSKFFHAYRGSIVLTFKVVKTEFHSGRLSIAFIPFDRLASGSLPTASVTAAKDVHRTIVDIREGGEFTIAFPYYSATQYRRLCENSDGVYGYVDVRVLNTLVAPDTVNSSVSVLIEGAACSDMELAIPAENTTNSMVFVPESGVCDVVSDTNGAVQMRKSLAPSAHAIGEKIQSVRSLIKRFCPIFPQAFIDSETDYTSLYIYPWTLWSGSVTSAALARGNYRSDNLSLLLAPFALLRGSARAKVLSRRTDEQQIIAGLQQYVVGGGNVGPIQYSDTLVLPYLYDHIPNTEPTAISRLNLTGACEVEVPFYSRTIASPIQELMTSTTASSALNGDTCVPSSYVVITKNNRTVFVPGDFAVYRALGDDASASLFMSTVALVDW